MKTSHLLRCVVLSALVGGITLSARAAETYLGAEAVLQKLKEKKTGATDTKPADPQAQLRQDLKSFKEKSRTLSPDAAAKEWLGLFDRLWQTKPQSRRPSPGEDQVMPVNFSSLLDALPQPAAWDALVKAVEQRPKPPEKKAASRERGLKMLAYTLVGDITKRQAVIAELEKEAQQANESESYLYRNMFQQLRKAMIESMDDPQLILKLLDQQIADAQGDFGNDTIELPNLVAIVGEKEAEAFLRRALVQPKVKLEVRQGTATQKLAQKLALELVQELKTPQWRLVNSLDAMKLYEAMYKKFSASEPAPVASVPGLPSLPKGTRFGGDYEEKQARTYYLLGLIAAKRTPEAVKVAQDVGRDKSVYLPSEAIEAMEHAGHGPAMTDFFEALLKENAGLPYWDIYVQLSANQGRTDSMLALVRQTLARKDLSPEKRVLVSRVFVAALLAADQVEEGVAELRRAAGLVPKDAAEADDDDDSDSGGTGLQLARLGQLLKHPEWVEEGLKLAHKQMDADKSNKRSYYRQSSSLELAKFLLKLGRGAEAEQVLLQQMTQQPPTNGQDWGGDNQNGALALLAYVYHEAGRFSDVIYLFDEAANWPAGDLATIYSEEVAGNPFSHYRTVSRPLGYLLADALIKTGRPEVARPIVNALVDHLPGSDRGYELLTRLDGTAAIGKLDETYSRDQFEERPLIWKAKLLFEAGRLEEAEQTARKAVTVDPSDGEQGPGDRMRVYSVLADIREKRGDKKEADIFRGAVTAIRLSEEADQYVQAGLLKRAVQMYKDSLNHFADAYCIQSRLAVELSEMGRQAEAEVYYQRAYELMPDSFGRVESHCFGCERAFAGLRAQSIAEKVFNKLAKERPEKPQVHYLLGYLRDAQGRHEEALPQFREAVRLDPDYLNAWLKIQEISEHVSLSRADKDRTALEILRLDPLQWHAHASVESVADLRALWNSWERASALYPKPVEKLYELKAARQRLAEQKNNRGNQYSRYTRWSNGGQESRLSPGQSLPQVAFVQVALQMVVSGSRFDE